MRGLLEKTRHGSSATDAPLGLRFEVIAIEPQQPWLVAVINRGDQTTDVVFDPRLFWFEVTPLPSGRAKPSPVRCRLPSPLFPERADPALVMRFAPGEGVVASVDPRLYCPPDRQRQTLTAGATVAAHFGWSAPVSAVWRKGKRVELAREGDPPFVASPEGVAPAPRNDDTAGLRPRKQLTATPFGLPLAYAPGEPADSSEAPPLELVMASGSDALTERQVTVTVALRNRSKHSQRVFFRRDYLSFQVVGPGDSVMRCEPGPDMRHPSPWAFRLLRPDRSLRFTSRLRELCPSGTFQRPGLYVVSAYFDAIKSGAEYGFAAFTGRLVSQQPALVRVLAGKWLDSGELMRIRDE